MATLKIQASRLLEYNLSSKRRYLIHQGGSRSSKTWSIIQFIIITALQSNGKTFTICRKTLPALKATALRDFIDQLKQSDLFDEDKFNKSELTYELNGNTIEFISVDQPQKIRGRKRDWLFVNECNELNLEDFRQLNMRTSEKVILDFNPSDSIGWHYDLIEKQVDEVDFFKSTYRDNPFLEKSIIKTIEDYKESDDLYWKVYGLGERGVAKANIYTNYNTYTEIVTDEYCYGLDFGWNHPLAFVKVSFKENNYYVQEVIYESHLTIQEFITKLDELKIDKTIMIYADAANPEAIENIKRAGYNIKAADKSVKAGIDCVKTGRLNIHNSSLNLLKEVQLYRWKVQNEIILDEPVKSNDDGCDAFRYGIYNYTKEHIHGANEFTFTYIALD